MKILLIFFSILFICGIGVYVYFNRESDRVVYTFITVLTIGALSFVTKESMSNKVIESKDRFSIVVFYSTPKYMPINFSLPYWFDLSYGMQNIPSADLPKHLESSENNQVQLNYADEKYFDLLQLTILETAFKFYTLGWNIKFDKVRTPNGESIYFGPENKDEDSTIINFQALLGDLKNNYFVQKGIHKSIADLIKLKNNDIYLPKNTSYEFTVDDKIKEFSTIIKNKFVTVSIILTYAGSGQGLGEFSDKIEAQPGTTGHTTFAVKTNITQCFWLNGHPDMEKHRNWADSFVENIKTNFSYELVREKLSNTIARGSLQIDQ